MVLRSSAGRTIYPFIIVIFQIKVIEIYDLVLLRKLFGFGKIPCAIGNVFTICGILFLFVWSEGSLILGIFFVFANCGNSSEYRELGLLDQICGEKKSSPLITISSPNNIILRSFEN